jgi:hypothetical protein
MNMLFVVPSNFNWAALSARLTLCSMPAQRCPCRALKVIESLRFLRHTLAWGKGVLDANLYALLD